MILNTRGFNPIAINTYSSAFWNQSECNQINNELSKGDFPGQIINYSLLLKSNSYNPD
jgi:hypothetical protein